jgi:hypothetical protein
MGKGRALAGSKGRIRSSPIRSTSAGFVWFQGAVTRSCPECRPGLRKASATATLPRNSEDSVLLFERRSLEGRTRATAFSAPKECQVTGVRGKRRLRGRPLKRCPPRSCTCPGQWREWCRRRSQSWSSSSCKLRGAKVMGWCGNFHVTTPPRLGRRKLRTTTSLKL